MEINTDKRKSNIELIVLTQKERGSDILFEYVDHYRIDSGHLKMLEQLLSEKKYSIDSKIYLNRFGFLLVQLISGFASQLKRKKRGDLKGERRIEELPVKYQWEKFSLSEHKKMIEVLNAVKAGREFSSITFVGERLDLTIKDKYFIDEIIEFLKEEVDEHIDELSGIEESLHYIKSKKVKAEWNQSKEYVHTTLAKYLLREFGTGKWSKPLLLDFIFEFYRLIRGTEATKESLRKALNNVLLTLPELNRPKKIR